MVSDKITVVIVEDERITREGLACAIDWEKYGCQVIGTAKDGREGMELILQSQPDIAFTDIQMLNMSGLEMMKELKNETDCKIIILSGYNDFSYAQLAIRYGARDYLLKPIDDEELERVILETVSAIMDQRQKQRLIQEPPEKVKFDESVKNSLSDKYLQRAMEIIREHYMESLTLRSIAAQLDISESYLGKLFKTKTSYTYLDYLVLYRMKRAVELLEHSELKIYEIALAVGYTDARYFSKTFQKIVGVKPSEYRDGYTLTEDNILNRLP